MQSPAAVARRLGHRDSERRRGGPGARSNPCPVSTLQQTAHCENLAKLARPCETKKLFAQPCETCICETLRNSYLRNLAKLVFAKLCETNVKLRNLYLQNVAKFVFAELARHDLRNNAKQSETLIAKIAKAAKIRLHCETMIQITKHCKQHGVFTAGREPETILKQTHWDATMGYRRQSPAPYHRKHRGTFLPVPHCLKLRPVTGCSEGGALRHWALTCWGRCCSGWRGYSVLQPWRGVPSRNEGGSIARAAAVTQKGLFPYHLQDTVKVFTATTPWGTRKELDSALEKRIWEFEAISQFHINFADILHFAYYLIICMLRAISQFHIIFADIPHVRNKSTFSPTLHFRNNHTCNMIYTEGSKINLR